MTDILIPLGQGSRHEDIELRYCLRSIEKHLKGVGNIFLVGEKPDWIQNVIHIPAKDNPNNWNRARNIYNKIVLGIDTSISAVFDGGFGFKSLLNVFGLSEQFLFMNDDHFLLRDYEASEFPHYHRGLLNPYNFHLSQPQLQQCLNTVNKTDFKTILDYDIHCPILYTKKNFKATFEALEWQEHGYCIKSLYCAANSLEINENKANIIECEDLKFSEPLLKETIEMVLEDREWFSIGDRVLKNGNMQSVLNDLYPSPSKYEL